MTIEESHEMDETISAIKETLYELQSDIDDLPNEDLIKMRDEISSRLSGIRLDIENTSTIKTDDEPARRLIRKLFELRYWFDNDEQDRILQFATYRQDMFQTASDKEILTVIGEYDSTTVQRASADVIDILLESLSDYGHIERKKHFSIYLDTLIYLYYSIYPELTV